MARKWPEQRVIVDNPPTPEQALAMCEAVVPVMAEILRPHWAELCRPTMSEEQAQEQATSAETESGEAG